jgi:hypothetical protein
MDFWLHALLDSSPATELREDPFDCTLLDAQDWCNFVVLRPRWLPADCRINGITARSETPNHPSSLRMFIEGDSRSMRLKQFFMDWWIPTSSDANLTAPGRTFVAAGIVGYLGRDYKGREAACIHRFGTLLEISISEGRFTDEEITGFFEKLEPEVPEAVAQIAALPFARVSYYARKGPGPGPWNYDLLAGCRWADDLVATKQFEPSKVLYPGSLPKSFAFDSIGTRIDPAIHHWEYQLLFRNQENWTDNIWLRAVGEETEKILWISPGLDRRMGIRLEACQLTNRRVRVGSTSSPHGERVAQWAERGVAFEVHARASLHINTREFLDFIDSLSPFSG